MGIPIDTKDPKNLRVFLFGSFLPIRDVSELAEAIYSVVDDDPQRASENSGSELLDFIGSRMNPQLRIPLELALNRTFYLGNSVERFPGEMGEMFGIPMEKRSLTYQTLQAIRLVSMVDRANVFSFNDVDSIMDIFEGVDRPHRGDEGGLMEKFLTSPLSPIPMNASRKIDLTLQAARTEEQMSRLRNNLIGDLRSVVEEQRVGWEENAQRLRVEISRAEHKLNIAAGARDPTERAESKKKIAERRRLSRQQNR
jgi:hypothetical protein